ncbi:MAG TPA: selenocysteine-specific translation elongation factor [Pyrinomonadaceae bacterium]|nr:selenocysteine-specific translation elongation factor [Pyrinomonadaceae bacterium]
MLNLEFLFMDIIVGTAGHIDHGKTALVKALTGVDADRLPEEKQRGITIDIGFAELDLGEVRIGFVDVPGHEKFVKNMLAGASGIDAVALVIASDEGVMPQTREHFEICRLLETKTGLVVLTKKDLVDEELLELVKLDASELVENSFLENAPMIPVSAKTGEGIEELKRILLETAAKIPNRKNETIARLPIDRSFTVKGFGAVVTGTLISGEISEGEELEILPLSQKVRVRGIQTHGKSVKTANAGQRTAVNLGGIEHSEIERGMVLAEKNVLRPAQIFDAETEVLEDAKRSLKSRQRVRVHIGTIEALARVQVLNEANEIAQGGKDFVQLRLETPIVAVPNERFIIRSYSPQITIAGGKILDAPAQKHRRKDIANVRKHLQNLIESENDKARQIKLFLETAGEHGLTFSDLQARTAWRAEILQKAIRENIEKKASVEAESFYIARTPFENLKTRTLAEIENFHKREPLIKGILRETLRERIFARLPPEIFKAVLSNLETENKIAAEKDIVRLASHSLELSAEEKQIRENLEKIYRKAGLEVPTLETALQEAIRGTKSSPEKSRKIFQLLLNSGEIVKVTEEFFFAKKAIDDLINKMREFAEAKTTDRLIDVAIFKEIAGVSRKYAIPLLEYFDREKITRRGGDKRLVL